MKWLTEYKRKRQMGFHLLRLEYFQKTINDYIPKLSEEQLAIMIRNKINQWTKEYKIQHLTLSQRKIMFEHPLQNKKDIQHFALLLQQIVQIQKPKRFFMPLRFPFHMVSPLTSGEMLIWDTIAVLLFFSLTMGNM